MTSRAAGKAPLLLGSMTQALRARVLAVPAGMAYLLGSWVGAAGRDVAIAPGAAAQAIAATQRIQPPAPDPPAGGSL